MPDLNQQFHELLESSRAELQRSLSDDQKRALKFELLGRKGKLAELFSCIHDLPLDERKVAGQTANAVKQELEKLFEGIGEPPRELTPEASAELHTWTKDKAPSVGHQHPLSLFMEKVQGVFTSLGFDIIDSPELESEVYNFDLLNIPADHPAREESDTFFVRKSKTSRDAILRTQTSPMQIRSMKNRKPPVRICVPGRVFRHEATDASHGSSFYQLEGFVIDTDIALSDLIGTLDAFIKGLFGKNTETRFRPHYYPFVEPGMDIDMKFKKPGMASATWLEILGSGMIHPVVLQNMGVDSNAYSGFAFGLGIDRLAMLYWGIEDVRHLYSGNMNFLRQF